MNAGHVERSAKAAAKTAGRCVMTADIRTAAQRHVNGQVTEYARESFADGAVWAAAQVITRNGDGGYGRIGFEGKISGAHRMAYEAWIDPLINGMVIIRTYVTTLHASSLNIFGKGRKRKNNRTHCRKEDDE